jgi:hypothetical protein
MPSLEEMDRTICNRELSETVCLDDDPLSESRAGLPPPSSHACLWPSSKGTSTQDVRTRGVILVLRIFLKILQYISSKKFGAVSATQMKRRAASGFGADA